MKKIKFMIFVFLLMCIGILGVSATEDPNCSVKIEGRNTFADGNLEAKVTCDESVGNFSKTFKWYYNTTNSTEGGTLISDFTGSAVYVTQDYVGKYIYVVVTVNPVNTNYNSKEFKDITDDAENTTAKVDDYIDYVEDGDFSVEIETTMPSAGATLRMIVSGLDDLNEDKTYYYAMISDSSTYPVPEQSNTGCNISADAGDITKYHSIDKNSEIFVPDDWYMLKGYENLFIVKQTGKYCYVYKNPITLEKPEILPIGSRYDIFLFSKSSSVEYDYLDVFPQFPKSGENGSHKLNTKIGLINDSELLSNVLNKKQGAMEALLEYAKTADGKVWSGFSDSSASRDKINIDNFEVINGRYYFIYTSYDNSDGLYRDLDDVTIAVGEHNDLVSYVEQDNKNIETTTPQKKESNPKTGIFTQFGIIGLLIILSVGLYIFIRNKSKFPKHS